MGVAAALDAKFSRVYEHREMPCRGRRTAANAALSKTQKEKAQALPTLDGAKVDNLLTEVVQPIGFWQIGLVLLNALSCPNTVVLPHQYPGGVVEEWNLVCSQAWEAPFNESAYMVGMCLGFVMGGWLSDRLGRRIAILTTGLAELVLCVLACLSPHHMFYASARCLIGACLSARIAVTTVIAAEFTTAKYRSILFAIGFVVQLTVQRLLIAILGYFVDRWRVLTGCMFILNSGVFIIYFVQPESPKWLAARGRTEATGRSLYAGYRTNLRFANLFSKKANRRTYMSELEFMALIGPPCLLTISETEEEENEEKDEIGNGVPLGDSELATHATKRHRSPCCRFLHWDLVWTTFLAIVLLTCHTISFYGIIFYSTHIRFHVSLVVAINALANLPGCFLSATLYRLFRFRKKPLLGLILTAATLQSVAALHTLILQPENDILLNVFGNIIILVQTAGFMMLFVYLPELYPPLQRNRGFGISAGVSRLGALTFPFI
ncbi:unnamed protein product, partial [Dibothriocephalus latus]